MGSMTDREFGKGQFINGNWINDSKTPLVSVNPANGEIFWQGYAASEEHINSAYLAAKKAFFKWSSLDFEQRCEFALSFSRQVEKKREELTRLIALETGKPLWEARTEVDSVIGKVKLSIQAYKERTTAKSYKNEITSSLRYKPHGVVTVLGAFNFPAHLSNGHIVPALLAGNTVLYKPSELTPSVAELIMICWQNSGIPDGVINCLQGDADSAKFILSQDIQGVYFTGSYLTGLNIHQRFADRPEVILALEMGGNNPLVIGEISNIQAAVYHTLLSGFLTAGQRCTCARRIIIPDSETGDNFLSQLIQSSQAIKTGEFTETPEPFMGPVISHEQAIKHLDAQKDLMARGGKALLKMRLLKENTGLLSPGIIEMTEVKKPLDQEIFAPLIQVYRYSDFEQALGLANETRYGLCAGLLSENEQQYHYFFNSVKAGLINWNRPTTGAASSLPFGGVGISGNHRPSAYFAADYCAYPIASQEQSELTLPDKLLPGLGE
ncbi:succinylglutamate-semialdehyde dehydrogenase [Legionella israelensis]|uniref:succinylglutamate-semialdehyde dehydrogenase n=1 Tax=Legionella israelensis TaxID=454 RepID=UPI001FD4CC2A|nr:succinylglutamate-semialdehyde dehydrogenase [Legionella israelensis]